MLFLYLIRSVPKLYRVMDRWTQMMQVGDATLYFPCESLPNFGSCVPSFLPSVLERKLNEIETEKFNIKQMKDMFEQKAAQLATEIVG